jgi:hypothetical protein
VFGTAGWAEVHGFETLTTHLSGKPPTRQAFPAGLAVGELLQTFATAVTTGAPFLVSTRSMLGTVAAFEATITSIHRAEPVRVLASAGVSR